MKPSDNVAAVNCPQNVHIQNICPSKLPFCMISISMKHNAYSRHTGKCFPVFSDVIFKNFCVKKNSDPKIMATS